MPITRPAAPRRASANWQPKDEEPLPQRAVGDEDPDYSPMYGFRGNQRQPGSRKREPDLLGAEGIASVRADEDTL